MCIRDSYAPAIELGLITPATVMDDTPYSFTDARHWPKNSDSVYRGLMNINEAVKHSINTIPVKLVAQMTPEYCFEFAKEKMGLSSLVSSYVNAAGDTFSDIDLAPLAMGGLTKGVSVKAMAQAYASFANEGVWREARTYTKVVDADGKVEVDTHAARIFMPLAELVDFEKELARIAKEKANAEKQLAGIENKLKNEGFLAKAPEAVVSGARADAEKLRALIEKLDASAAAMKK